MIRYVPYLYLICRFKLSVARSGVQDDDEQDENGEDNDPSHKADDDNIVTLDAFRKKK